MCIFARIAEIEARIAALREELIEARIEASLAEEAAAAAAEEYSPSEEEEEEAALERLYHKKTYPAPA